MCTDSKSKFRMIPIIGVAVASGSSCFCGSLGVAVGSGSGCCGVRIRLLRGPGQVAAGSWSGCCCLSFATCKCITMTLLSHVARLITIGTIAPRTSCAAGPTAWGNDASVNKYSPNSDKSIHLKLD